MLAIHLFCKFTTPCHGSFMLKTGACRGVRCEAAFSPTFSGTPFSPTIGATTEILSATPNFEVLLNVDE